MAGNLGSEDVSEVLSTVTDTWCLIKVSHDLLLGDLNSHPSPPISRECVALSVRREVRRGIALAVCWLLQPPLLVPQNSEGQVTLQDITLWIMFETAQCGVFYTSAKYR